MTVNGRDPRARRAARCADATLHRVRYAYVVPLLRAVLLVQVLGTRGDPGNQPTRSQDTEAWVTRRFMHPAVRRTALGRIFSNLKFACRRPTKDIRSGPPRVSESMTYRGTED